MSSLREVAEDYLRMRRALGYKLELAGWQLEKFVTYLEQTDATTVTIENAVTWATSAGADPSYWAHAAVDRAPVRPPPADDRPGL